MCLLPPSLGSGLPGSSLPPLFSAGGLISFLSDSLPLTSLLSPLLPLESPWAGRVLLTHKDSLAVHRGRVLVQGQGVRGQLLWPTAFRLRNRDEKKEGREGAWGGDTGVMKLALSFSFWSSSYFKLNECCRQRASFKDHWHKLHGQVSGRRSWGVSWPSKY